jgi:hypothetical protein
VAWLALAAALFWFYRSGTLQPWVLSLIIGGTTTPLALFAVAHPERFRLGSRRQALIPLCGGVLVFVSTVPEALGVPTGISFALLIATMAALVVSIFSVITTPDSPSGG